MSDIKKAKLLRLLQSKQDIRFANPHQVKKALHKLGPEWGDALVVDGGSLPPDTCFVRSDWQSDLGPLKERWRAVPEVRVCWARHPRCPPARRDGMP